MLSIALFFLAGFPERAAAAICNATAGPKHDFQFLAGSSPDSSTWIGVTEDRRFGLAGFMYSYRCWSAQTPLTKTRVDVSYTAGVLPAAVLLQPALPNFRALTPSIIPAHAVYGVAVLPVGFTAYFGRRTVQPFLETHGGVIASAEPIPINATNATGLNFLFDFGSGVRFRIGDRRAINLGYKFLHISNANTTNFNPGVDNNVIFVGFSLLR